MVNLRMNLTSVLEFGNPYNQFDGLCVCLALRQYCAGAGVCVFIASKRMLANFNQRRSLIAASQTAVNYHRSYSLIPRHGDSRKQAALSVVTERIVERQHEDLFAR